MPTVWSDVPSDAIVDKSGKKYVHIKFTGSDKVRVLVCLTAKTHGKKLNPFIVFGKAK